MHGNILRHILALSIILISSFFVIAAADVPLSKSFNRKLQMGGGGGGGRPEMGTIHKLVNNRVDIYRQVNNTDYGIKTTTWSNNSDVAAWIIQHVKEMKALVDSDYGVIRRWDDLFSKVFEMRDYHNLEYNERVDGKGVVVEQQGQGDCAISLVQAHAKVVSAFIERGYDELHKNHDVPAICQEGYVSNAANEVDDMMVYGEQEELAAETEGGAALDLDDAYEENGVDSEVDDMMYGEQGEVTEDAEDKEGEQIVLDTSNEENGGNSLLMNDGEATISGSKQNSAMEIRDDSSGTIGSTFTGLLSAAALVVGSAALMLSD